MTTGDRLVEAAVPAPNVEPVPDSAWAPDLRALTVGLVLTITFVALEALAVATVMPRVAADLDGIGLYGWVFSSFFLGNLLGIVLAGELIDRRGLLPPYSLGLGLFAAGLLVGGLAPSMPILILGRAVQGLGAGAVPAVAYVSIARDYPAAVRPKMFAYLSSAWVVPGLVGPAIACFVGDAVGWRAVFLGLIPFVGLAAVITVPSLRVSRGVALEAGSGRTQVDAPPPVRSVPFRLPAGLTRLWLALRVAVGASLLLAALDERDPRLAVGLGAAGIVAGVPALRRLLPAGTLRAQPGLPLTVLLRGVLAFAFTGAEAYLPLTLVSIRGTSASIAGLALTAATITWALGSWIQAHRIGDWGAPRLIRLGFAIVAVGIATIASVLDRNVPIQVAVLAWGVSGFGMGLSYPATSLTVLSLAPPAEQGAATAGLQLSDVLGTALGAGSGGAIVAVVAASNLDPRLGLAGAFALAALVGLTGLVLSFRLVLARDTV